MDYETIILSLTNQLDEQIVINKKLSETNDILSHNVENMSSTISELQETIKELNETVNELRRQLNQNSQNSSKPPSSDGYNKPKPKSLRVKTGKSKGGQIGHKGHNISLPHEADEVKIHLPGKCLSCSFLVDCLKSKEIFKCNEKRYVIETVAYTKVIEHQSVKACKCPIDNTTAIGDFPDDVKAYIQYGNSVNELVSVLSTYGAMSINRISTLMKSLFDISLSTGTIPSMISRCSDKVSDTLSKIKKHLSDSYITNFDETGLRTLGALYWVHNSSNEYFTYQTIHTKRGIEGIEDNGVLNELKGVAVHDCWSPYFKKEDIKHSVCNIHLLRELEGVTENNPDHLWSSKFKKLLLDMKKVKENAQSRGKDHLSTECLDRISKRYDRILNLADNECPYIPEVNKAKRRGRKKKGKERSLIERMKRNKNEVCLFIHDFDVPFGNNQAEQDLRNIKTKAKVSGCFRTVSGAQDYLNIMSYLSTARKHDIGIFEAIKAAFEENPDIVLN